MRRPMPNPYGPLFDPAHYRRQLAAPAPDPVRHFRRRGDALGLDPCAYFSTTFYKARYPDWAANGARTALDDFLAHQAGGVWRQPHPLVDPAAYLQSYPDVAAAGIAPVVHFIAHGDAEGRSPSQGFDAGFYRRCYLPLNSTHPFLHYLRHGQAAGHLPRPHPRTADLSRAAMAAVLAGRRRPVVLAAHDAQPAGVPILLRDMAARLVAEGRSPVFLLGNGGPVVLDLAGMGPVFLLAEGWHTGGLLAGCPATVPVVVHSAAAAAVAAQAARAGHPTALLIHEMRGYLAAQGLIPALRQAQDDGAWLVASFDRVATALAADLGRLDVVQPGLALPPAGLGAFRQQRRNGAGSPLFIGAGHADRRKGFDLFLDAARDIARAWPQARFVWLGSLDPWARDLADRALGEGLPLDLPGFVSDSLAWYAAATVYLLTSREDPGPATLVHAMATGTGFVGYAADIGLQEMAAPFGRFVPPGDRAQFVAAALALARTDTPAQRHARRKGVRPHVGFARYCETLLRRLDPGCR